MNALTLWTYPEQATLVGASGVVYFMVGFWVISYFFIERAAKKTKRILTALGVSLILFFPTEYEPHVSYTAHAIGFMVGVASGVSYFFLNRSKIRKSEVWVETETQLEQDELNANPQSFTLADRMSESMEEDSQSEPVSKRIC